MYPETTEDLVNVSDLEDLFTEPPPTCQVLVEGEVCGKLATFIWHCICNTQGCTRKIPDLFACKECHDYVTTSKLTWLCAGCKMPVTMKWLPL
jgi:hypothetical protein